MSEIEIIENQTEMHKIRILNAFSGIGGNRVFLNEIRYGAEYELEITAIDFHKEVIEAYQKEFPSDKTILGDAFEYIQLHHSEYDIIWASPPCQSHSKLTKMNKRQKVKPYPDLRLYSLIIFLNQWFKGYFVVENTQPYYNGQKPLLPAFQIDRHLFWSNVNLNTEINLLKLPNFSKQTNQTHKEYLQSLQEFYFIKLDKNIYFKPNHDPAQVYRNCVDPFLGLHLFQQLINAKIDELKLIPYEFDCNFYEEFNSTCILELLKDRIDLSKISYKHALEYWEDSEICDICIQLFEGNDFEEEPWWICCKCGNIEEKCICFNEK